MDRAELSRLLGRSMAGGEPRDVIVEEREPAAFMAAFSDAVAAGGRVFLADPTWGKAERAQFAALVAKRGETDGRGWLCIPTGGSSGNIKLARHDERTLSAAVSGFVAHFGVKPVNQMGVLPLYHVSGLMAWMRAVMTGGVYLPVSWRDVSAGERPPLPVVEGDWFLSLVPTQLQRLLGDREAEEWLHGFHAVFIGGGPAWPELIEAGFKARLPLAFSYGMTETAAMVTALRPEEFLAGKRGCGAVLPHAQVTIQSGGRIALGGESLFGGYWPDTRAERWLETEDVGRFDANGSLHVEGRRDALIISGGEKIDPAEVERVLRGTGQFSDVAVIGVPDATWGESVVACYPAGSAPTDRALLERLVAVQLAGFKQPKRYVPIVCWPRNEQGKVNRALLRAQVLDLG